MSCRICDVIRQDTVLILFDSYVLPMIRCTLPMIKHENMLLSRQEETTCNRCYNFVTSITGRQIFNACMSAFFLVYYTLLDTLNFCVYYLVDFLLWVSWLFSIGVIIIIIVIYFLLLVYFNIIIIMIRKVWLGMYDYTLYDYIT